MAGIFSKKRHDLTEIPRSVKMANNLLLSHYSNLQKKKKLDKPVAWIGIDIPSYIFSAMDIVPVYPQIHASFQAERKAVKKMMDDLESKWEIPHNICGEAKGTIGTILCDSELAFNIPKPDILVISNSTCGQMLKAFKYLSDYMGVELLQLDFPFIYDDLTDEILDYAVKQVEHVFSNLETRFSRKFDLKKMNEIANVSMVFSQLWKDICDANMRSPAPIDSSDLYLFISCFHMLESNDKLLDMFVVLYNEIYEQIRRNEKTQSQERFRVLWHYLPIYSKKNFFKKLCNEYGVTIVMGTSLPMYDDFSSEDQFKFTYPITKEQLEEAKKVLSVSGSETYEEAKKYLIRYSAELMMKSDYNRSVKTKYQKIKRMIEDYKIDGVILHNDRSCRPQSLPQYELNRYFTDDLDIPVLYFDSDTMDERFFSESQITTRFEAFIEKMETKGY